MRVLMFSPGFPVEMQRFTVGLSEVGAEVVGLGDAPTEHLPPEVARRLSANIRVPQLWDEVGVVAAVREHHERRPFDRVECLWEPGMLLAAKLREALGVPGMTVEQTLPFRDKERMKAKLDACGIRTPHHIRASGAREIREAAERIGFPLIVKPVDGAGSRDTHRVDDAGALDQVLPRIAHVPSVSVEEYVDGEEFTYDSICANGVIRYFNIAWYRPKPLIGRSVESISPMTVTLRNVDQPLLAPGREMGPAVIEALGFRTGFTHMEWFLTPDGEAVFCEIAARPPGARSVDLMNYGSDIDTYVGWAEAACHGTFGQPVERRHNVAVVFKRARGSGRIRAIEGLERLLGRYGSHVVCVDLLPPGAPRRDWRQTLVSDGYVIVRHPDLRTTLDIADRFGTDLLMHAS